MVKGFRNTVMEADMRELSKKDSNTASTLTKRSKRRRKSLETVEDSRTKASINPHLVRSIVASL